jgi:hypothetical protein
MSSYDRAVAQGVSRRHLTVEAQVRVQASPCRICVGQSGIGTDFSPTPSVFPNQYHVAVAPYSGVSSGGWTKGLLEAQFRRNIVSHMPILCSQGELFSD